MYEIACCILLLWLWLEASQRELLPWFILTFSYLLCWVRPLGTHPLHFREAVKNEDKPVAAVHAGWYLFCKWDSVLRFGFFWVCVNWICFVLQYLLSPYDGFSEQSFLCLALGSVLTFTYRYAVAFSIDLTVFSVKKKSVGVRALLIKSISQTALKRDLPAGRGRMV